MEIKLEFLEVSSNSAKPKATIHKTGKLGFNKEAITFMGLDLLPFFKLAINKEEEYGTGDKIYLLKTDNKDGSMRPAKAGIYYYLNVGGAFDKIGLDYKNSTIIFDITKDAYEGQILYVLSKRVLLRSKKK